MLNTYTSADGGPSAQTGRRCWYDLLNPTAEETARVVAECGVQVPSREALQEIETSSRLRADGQVLYLSTPLAIADESAAFTPIPLGFILSPTLLVTVRYSEVHAFEHVRSLLDASEHFEPPAVFAALIDSMVDFSADMLEKLSSDLAAVSAQTFGHKAPGLRDNRLSQGLRECLARIGNAGAQSSRIRESLLGLQRITGFVAEMAAGWSSPELLTHMKTARQDLSSLVDFESHLSGKTQFLLDAVLGFISTEQNDIFKVLTIASVVGIPPTLIASMYGMNFHYMPELSWRWGYIYGLSLIALSALLPILWFKRRGWW